MAQRAAYRRRKRGTKNDSNNKNSGLNATVLSGAVTKKPTRSLIQPSDPRLGLSLRAFCQSLQKNKRRPRYDPQSQDARMHMGVAATRPSQCAYREAVPELYDPVSPWGVLGIKYDPMSPRWPSKSVASPQSSPSPSPGPEYGSLYIGEATAPFVQIPDSMQIHHGQQHSYQNGAGSVLTSTLMDIIDSIIRATSQQQTPRRDDWQAAYSGAGEQDESEEATPNGHYTNNRFIVTNGHVDNPTLTETNGTSPQASLQASAETETVALAWTPTTVTKKGTAAKKPRKTKAAKPKTPKTPKTAHQGQQTQSYQNGAGSVLTSTLMDIIDSIIKASSQQQTPQMGDSPAHNGEGGQEEHGQGEQVEQAEQREQGEQGESENCAPNGPYTNNRFVVTNGHIDDPTLAEANGASPQPLAEAETAPTAPTAVKAKVKAVYGKRAAKTSRKLKAAKPKTPKIAPSPIPITTPTPHPSTPAVEQISRCCPMDVPSILHMILDKSGNFDPRMVMQFSTHVNHLCPDHLHKYLRLITSMPSPQWPALSSNSAASEGDASPCTELDAGASMERCAVRKTMLSRHGPRSGRRSAPSQLEDASLLPQLYVPPPHVPPRQTADRDTQYESHVADAADGRNDQSVRPVADAVKNDIYRRQMIREIEERFDTVADSESTHGGVTNRVVHSLLSVAHQPNACPESGPVDVHFLTGDEAREMLDSRSPKEPVVTDKEQMFKWKPRLRPIAELFQRMENLDRSVSVQVPSRSCMEDSFESRELTQVRDRLLGVCGVDSKDGKDGKDDDDDPWNILDLRSPLPAAVLPQFLTSENCQLLPRLRDEVLNPSRAERDMATREQWNEWRDVLEWVLLSQGGHNTSPHTDSHGLATWITVQEGRFGFGWMSNPTAAEREGWTADPQGFRGGRWCFLVLEPGQTVFFNSGTVHFVFRLRTEATLALGGHILQWSGIEQWLEVVAAQMKNPHITNEDMEWSAPKYVRVVAKLVELRLQNGRVDEMGGEAAVRRLLGLLQDFDEKYIEQRPKPKVKRRKRVV